MHRGSQTRATECQNTEKRQTPQLAKHFAPSNNTRSDGKNDTTRKRSNRTPAGTRGTTIGLPTIEAEGPGIQDPQNAIRGVELPFGASCASCRLDEKNCSNSSTCCVAGKCPWVGPRAAPQARDVSQIRRSMLHCGASGREGPGPPKTCLSGSGTPASTPAAHGWRQQRGTFRLLSINWFPRLSIFRNPLPGRFAQFSAGTGAVSIRYYWLTSAGKKKK